MAATLSEIGSFWASGAASQYPRWLGACLKAAYAVTNEDVATTNHAARLVWAHAVLSDNEAEMQRRVLSHMKYAIASNNDLQTNPTGIVDGDITYIVASQLDILTS